MKSLVLFAFLLISRSLAQTTCTGYASILTNKGSTLNYTYDPINDVVVYDVCVPDGNWFAIGYGSSMTNTDMVWWSANTTNSTQLDLYSLTTTTPSIDAQNAYTTVWTLMDDNSVKFRSTRPLNVNLGLETYVIQLDVATPMVAATLTSSPWLYWHGFGTAWIWTMTLNTPAAGCFGTSNITTSNGSLLNATYDFVNDVVVYDVCVQSQSYLAIGYGTTMTNTDMVWWSANGTNSQQLDLYSTGHTLPATDPVNSYTTNYVVNLDGSVQFRSTRALNPNTGMETYVIQLNQDIPMIYAFLPTSPNLQYHGSTHHQQWTMFLSAPEPGCVGTSDVMTSNGSLLNVTYDSVNDVVVYDVCVQANSWMAVGYGTSMTNTDMVWWSANGTLSQQLDLYSTGETMPVADAVNAYNTTYNINSDNSVQFRSTRFLNPNTGPETFVIQLNTNTPMIYAFLPTSPTLSYHGSSNTGSWTMNLYNPPPGCVGTSDVMTSNGSLLNVTYDLANNVVVYNVCVQPNSWMAVGYGTSMTNTDMVWWSANGTLSQQLDLYSTGETMPSTDPINCYNTTYNINSDNSVSFTSTRFLNPNIGNETFVITLGVNIPMIYAFLPTSPNLSFHGNANTGSWTMNLPAPPAPGCIGSSLISTSNGSMLNATYDYVAGVVVYDVCVQPNSYMAIGYGTSMTNTDMVYWGANGAESVQLDLYSTGETMPGQDAFNAYNTTFSVNQDNSVQFRSTRLLNPNTSPETYVIQLNTPTPMICAFLPTSYVLQFHGNSNTFSWTMNLSSGPAPGCIGTSQVTTNSGSMLNATYDSTQQVVIYDVCVQPNSYMAIGYGTSMTDTDMVYWGANGLQSLQLDLYSTGETTPYTDPINAYNTTFYVNDDGSVTFRSTRLLNPNVGNETYVIQLNTKIPMICAFENTTYALVYHGSSNHFTWTMNLGKGSKQHKLQVEGAVNLHGIFMWVSWTILGLIQICTNRYFVHKYSWRQMIHTLSGLILCGTVLSAFSIIWVFVVGQLELKSYHNISGFITVILCIMVTLGGLAVELTRRSSSLDWKTSILVTLKKIHVYFGYFVLLIAQTAVTTGIYLHFNYISEHSLGLTLAVCNGIFFFFVLAILEIRHRKFLAGEESFSKVQKSMTIHEFEEAVARGDQLVILDEFVLDVAPFIKYHPGGQFVLRHNMGQDVSKFFHGGYALEGNLGPRPSPGIKHSNYARLIVNDLIIAQLDRKITVQSTICKVDQNRTVVISPNVHGFYFESGRTEPVPNFKRFYPGQTMFGKHFTIRAMTGSKPTRHYTICNSMQPDVYQKLVSSLRDEKREPSPGPGVDRIQDDQSVSTISGITNNRSNAHFPEGSLEQILPTIDQTSMFFVIKNYNQPTGVSEKIFNSEADFEVKGPMGKSLNISSSGLHVAFAAGTGILPFMDLIAHVAFLNLGLGHLLGSKAESRIGDDFKLKVYVSNLTRKSCIGLDLLEALQQYCRKTGLTNFELVLRISNEGKAPRWDGNFIAEQLSGFKEAPKKVWVCGPPVMSETFDRKFAEIKASNPDRYGTGVLEVL